MELFNEYKNRYFECIQNITNDIYSGVKYKESDIKDFIENNTFNELEYSLVDNILNNKSKYTNKNGEECTRIKLFKQENDIYSLSINSPIPIRPTNIERKWLKMLIEDSKGKANLDDNISQKLLKKLKYVESNNLNRYWIQKNIDKNGDEIDETNFNRLITILSTAIQEEKLIKYTSVNKNKEVFENNICFPYRIEYSIKNNKYRVIALPKGYDRAIKINVSSFKSIEIINEIDNETNEKILSFINGKKNLQEPLVLEIENKFNTVERCFSLFSYYDKEAYYDREKNKHILKVYYYSFDEAEIIKDILSLGSCVIVIEPAGIRNKIIERIRKALYS